MEITAKGIVEGVIAGIIVAIITGYLYKEISNNSNENVITVTVNGATANSDTNTDKQASITDNSKDKPIVRDDLNFNMDSESK